MHIIVIIMDHKTILLSGQHAKHSFCNVSKVRVDQSSPALSDPQIHLSLWNRESNPDRTEANTIPLLQPDAVPRISLEYSNIVLIHIPNLSYYQVQGRAGTIYFGVLFLVQGLMTDIQYLG